MACVAYGNGDGKYLLTVYDCDDKHLLTLIDMLALKRN